MPSNKKLLQAAAGSAGGDPLYAEDVFSTYLYDGNGSTNVITNGIDLAGEGGLVWGKSRDNAFGHMLIDTVRGGDKGLVSNATSAEYDNNTMITSFNSNGFTLGSYLGLNYNGDDVASWTFRKAEKFFDVVTWTGNSTAGRQISHSLGSTPGFIITKRTDGADNWKSYHVGNPSPAEDHVIELDNTNAAGNESIWNDTAPTSTNFTVSAGGAINGNGMTYVAYLFASDAGGFGDDGSESIIKCGSFTTDGSSDAPLQNIGFEPQWIMTKSATGTADWYITDSMRDMSVSSSRYLIPNSSSAETLNAPFAVWVPHAQGFSIDGLGTAGETHIYIAIRRPMKTPESGTEVFALQNPGYPLGSNGLAFTSGFPVDWALSKEVSATDDWLAMSRLQGAGNRLRTNTSAAESGGISSGTFDHMTGWYKTTSANMSWMFKRARGFMDVVVPTATQSLANPATEHNLGVVPELMISKSRNNTSSWFVYHSALGLTKYLALESTNAYQSYNVFGTTLTSTQFQYYSQTSGESIVNYLFATLAGVSKVGSYTGTGSDLNVDCGFSAGARWVMIKRSDISDGVANAGDWYVWDSVRGIVAGNDPYILLNSAAAQVTNTDYIDPLSSGFTVTSSAPNSLNKSGGTYIFLAIA